MKSQNRNRISGNYYDIENGHEYRIEDLNKLTIARENKGIGTSNLR